jgi:hypothetical protein
MEVYGGKEMLRGLPSEARNVAFVLIKPTKTQCVFGVLGTLFPKLFLKV